MDIYGLESLQEKIFFSKTREYFEEVISSYNNQNYRSATVMIWSVVVYDLVLKLQHLVDAYDDKSAKEILTEIKRKQIENSKSSSWESYLIVEVCNKTDLIDNFELTNLEYVQQQRHLSAHPIIKDSVELYIPNRDTVRSLIRNALEIVLIKPPIYTQRVLDSILADLSDNKVIFSQIEDVERFTKRKYLQRLSSDSLKKIFRSFWKLVFIIDNEDCKKNRLVNFMFLCVMVDNYQTEINSAIEEEKDFFSNILNLKNEILIHYLLLFLYRDPVAYEYFNEDIKIRIDRQIEDRLDSGFLCYFLYKDITQYYEYLEDLVREKYTTDIPLAYWKRLLKVSDSNELEAEFTELLGLYYSLSMNFDTADNRFIIIKHFIDLFNEKSLIKLLELSEENNQTYNRGKAPKDYFELREFIKSKYKDFDFSPFTNFLKQVAWHEETLEDEDLKNPEESKAVFNDEMPF